MRGAAAETRQHQCCCSAEEAAAATRNLLLLLMPLPLLRAAVADVAVTVLEAAALLLPRQTLHLDPLMVVLDPAGASLLKEAGAS